ncbi:MAG: histidine kinase dimerization/phospho-acceptor domain-containing protein [Syntrophotaleaceae bacterium]
MSVAAHELRTPLTAILGYAELCMNPEEFGGFSDAQQKNSSPRSTTRPRSWPSW